MWTQGQTISSKKRKFVLIAKIDADKFVKYRGNDMMRLTEFMVNKYPDLRYINFFINSGVDKGKQVASWGKKKGLVYL